MRVLVCGGRDWTETEFVYRFLDRLKRREHIDVIIEGNARGVDRMAGFWARQNRIDNLKFPAKWREHGKAAGPIRNMEMLEKGRPNLLVAFPGGKGTEDMVRRARKAGIKVIRVMRDGQGISV